MILNTVRTIYSVKLQTAMLFNKPYNVLFNTTLNEKFDIYPNYRQDPNIYPKVNLLTIGAYDTPTDSSLDLSTPYHSALDGSLFNHIPFLVKPVESGISAEESALYKLRKTVTIDGTIYNVFYGMLLNPDNIIIEDEPYLLDSKNGFINKYDTTFDTTILDPQPITGNILDSELKTIVNIAKLKLTFDNVITNNIYNAYKIITGRDEIPLITELGLCSSVLDTTVEGYVESFVTQINFFIHLDIKHMLENRNMFLEDGFTLYLEIGGLEPLLGK